MLQTLEFPGLGLTLHVNRVAFSIGGFHIYWYAIMLTLGLIAGCCVAYLLRERLGFSLDNIFDTALFGAIGGIIGARAYYVLFKLEDFHSFWDVINIRDGGMAFYGSVIGAVIAVLIVSKIRRFSFLNMADAAAPAFLFAQAIGRWGNFFNIEAFGGTTTLPWGMKSDSIYEYLTIHKTDIELSGGKEVDVFGAVHPCFLYESVWCLVGGILLYIYARLRPRRFKGEFALMYIIWYGVGRGFIETLRTDALTLGRLRVSMALSFIAAAVAAVALTVKLVKARMNGESAEEAAPAAELAGQARKVGEASEGETMEEKAEEILEEKIDETN